MKENYLKEELYEKLKTDNDIIKFLLDNTLDGVWYWDLEKLENEWLSPKFWEILGYNPDEKRHSSLEWQSIIHPKDLKASEENFKQHLKDPDYPYDQIVRYKHKNGSTVWVRCRGIAIRDKAGKPTRMLGAHVNVTDLMDSNKQVSKLKTEYETVFNGTQDALFLINVKGPMNFKFLRNNETHQKRTGITQLMIEGKSPYDLLGQEAGEAVSKHYQDCVDEEAVVTYEETLHMPSGTIIWHTTLTPIFLDGRVKQIVGSAIDITKQKQLENELYKRANYDMLTGLANRDFLTRKLEECSVNLDKEFAFIFIDLDNFKNVNDTYSHAVGDILLKEVSNRLLSLVGKDDFVARLGGDEFVILKCDINDIEQTQLFMDTIKATVSESITIETATIKPRASVGHSYFPSDGLSYDQLSRKADKRMYKDKQTNK